MSVVLPVDVEYLPVEFYRSLSIVEVPYPIVPVVDLYLLDLFWIFYLYLLHLSFDSFVCRFALSIIDLRCLLLRCQFFCQFYRVALKFYRRSSCVEVLFYLSLSSFYLVHFAVDLTLNLVLILLSHRILLPDFIYI